VFAIHMTWFEGELVFLPCIFYILLFSCIFFILTCHLASHVILTCICLIMSHCARMRSNEM
jgi:hypothetical protein